MSTQYTDFIKITAQACKNKNTGCVVFTSDSGTSGRIFIKAGRIVGLEHGEKKGVDCLSSMVEISQIDSHEFKEMPVIFGGTGIPETTVLLSALIQRKPVFSVPHEGEVEPSKLVSPVISVSVTAPQPPQGLHTKGSLSSSQKNVIRDNLMELIGPMADFLVEEHVDHADSIEKAMLGLQQDIDADSLAKLRVAVSKIM